MTGQYRQKPWRAWKRLRRLIDKREPVAASVPAELVQHVNEGETVPPSETTLPAPTATFGNKVQMGIASKAESRLHESLHAQK